MEIDFVNSAFINEDNIFYKELKVKHLKVIYKCLLGNEPNPDLVFANFNNIIKLLTYFSDIEIEQLDFVTYFILLLEIRCTSIGNIIVTELTDKTNTKVEINIYHFINTLKNIIADNNIFLEDKIDNFTVSYKLPCINDILKFKNLATFDDIYPYFVNTILLNETTIDFEAINKNDYQLILNQIPAKITSVIIKKVYKIIENFNKINLLKGVFGLEDKNLYFNFNVLNLVAILKLIFGDQLLSLYENVLVLAKVGNLSPEYIENCTPGEYMLYLKKIEQLNAQQNKQPPELAVNTNTTDSLNPYNSSDIPPITSRSEFTP